MINGNFDKDFDMFFEVYVDLYHQYKSVVDMIGFYGDQLLSVKAANALQRQEIERLEIKLEFKGKH